MVITEDIVLIGEDAVPRTVLKGADGAFGHSNPIVFNQHILDLARVVPGHVLLGAVGARGLNQ